MEKQQDNNPMDPLVLLENVVISHDEEPLLKNVGLSIRSGEFVYLIGKSGAGKTSLLRTLYADQPIESGTARVCGIDLTRIRRRQIPLLRRQIGIVFQNFRLLDDRNVYANLEFVLKAVGWRRRDEIKSQIEKTLQAIGIAHKADAMPRQLSEGEQQRVGIARALINNPLLVLADEPTGNLDPVTSGEIMQLLVAVGYNTGTAMLISTHDFMMIDRYPARVVVCENGTVVDTERGV